MFIFQTLFLFYLIFYFMQFLEKPVKHVLSLSTEADIKPLQCELMYDVNHLSSRSLRVLLLLRKKLKKRHEGRNRYLIQFSFCCLVCF